MALRTATPARSGRHTLPRRGARVACFAAAAALAAWPATFLAAGPATRGAAAVAPPASAASLTASSASAKSAAASGSSTAAAFGAWTAAAALASLGSRVVARRAAEEEREPFDVWKPDTYGNLTMDDVKKYGAAGTLSYVITELIFWAVAFPTEIGVFYQTAGRWPDFSNDMDKAAVLGFVFAASNLARLVLPLRFGAALAMAPWVDENIMSKLPGANAKA